MEPLQSDIKPGPHDGMIALSPHTKVDPVIEHHGKTLTLFVASPSAPGAGGLHWGTFKATCRRQGEWREDFNELLADPLNRRIAVEWDRVLNQLLPDHVDNLLRRIVDATWSPRTTQRYACSFFWFPLGPGHADFWHQICQEIWKLQRGMDLPLEPFQDAEELVKRQADSP